MEAVVGVKQGCDCRRLHACGPDVDGIWKEVGWRMGCTEACVHENVCLSMQARVFKRPRTNKQFLSDSECMLKPCIDFVALALLDA